MNNTSRITTLGGILIVAIVALAGIYVYQARPAQQVSDDKFGEQVRAYLLENPQVIREAIEVLTAQEQKAEEDASRQALASSITELEQDGYSAVMGNPDGDVTIVEFFDYRCGYCKRAFPDLMKTVKDDGNIRVVMKEFPILGDQSVLAAKAVMAAQNQGKYDEFHALLMNSKGSYTVESLKKQAVKIGLDPSQLEQDMKSNTITHNIQRTYALARALGISGTPAFVIGGTLVPGAIPASRMAAMVAEAREKNASTATN